MDSGAVRTLLEHGVLGALVVIQTGVIIWLITKLVDVSTRIKSIEAKAARIDMLLDDTTDELDKPN